MSVPVHFRIFLSSLIGSRTGAGKAPKRRGIPRMLRIVELEDRVVPSAVVPYIIQQPGDGGENPIVGPIVQGYTFSQIGNLSGYIKPAQLQTDYGENLAVYGSVVGNGAGQTIAIVDANNDPNIASDLATFDSQWGLPAPPNFLVVNSSGQTSPLPSNDASISVETSLDVEYAHVMAPSASILLVESPDDNTPADLAEGIAEARSYTNTTWCVNGASVVSISYGYTESSGNSGSDTDFATASTSHDGVTFFASSGDEGAYVSSSTKGVYWPAEVPNVVAVGGTTLTQSNGTYTSEAGWGNSTNSYGSGGSGGGLATLYSQPSYQVGKVNGLTTTKRAVPDISMDADPNSGVAVYDSYAIGNGGWEVIGGTSLSSPMTAGMIAVADQVGESFGATNTLNAFGSPQQTQTDLYNLPAIDFHDITTGNNGYAATSGYDLVTGRGTPYYSRLVADMAADLAGVTLTLNASVSGGNLTITGGAANDNVTITVSGTNYLITSATSPITAGTGATQVSLGTNLLSTQSITVPISSVTGTISFAGGAGNDTLTVDYSNGAITKAISYDGGTGTNSLVLKGGTQGTVTNGYTGSAAGSIVVANEDTVTYANTQSLADTGGVTSLVLNLPTGVNNLTLADDGTAGNGLSQISGSTIPTTIFSNPSSLLTLNRNSVTDTDNITLNALPDFTAGLMLGASATPLSSVTFAGPLTLASGSSLAAYTSSAIGLTTAASDLATSGTGTVTLTSSKTIGFASGSSITAVNGNISLSANQQATPTTGTFSGISLIGGTVQTTGTGAITLQGAGGTMNTGDYGIFVSGGTIAAGGALTLLGIASNGATPAIHFDSASTASSGGTAGLSITADSLEIADAGSTISAGSGTATIAPQTAGTMINLGGADILVGSPLTLGLTAAELNSITAGTLIIGSAASGTMTVNANITRSAATAMQLISGGDIAISGGEINTDGGTLQLAPGSTGSVKPTEAGVDIASSTTSFASGSNFTANLNGTTVDSQYTQLNENGTVNLTGTYLLLTGSYVPNAGDTFTIVSATQLNGTFNNYPASGAQIAFNGGTLQLNYTPTGVTLTTVGTTIVVNNGAVQRSRLTTITVNFSSPVDASTLTAPGAITLTSTGNYPNGPVGEVVQTGATGANGLINVAPSSGMVSSVTLTFSNADGSGLTAGVEYGSLADGEWQLAIPSVGYTSAANNPTLHRLFGDINGDGTVTAGGDQIVFDSTFGTTYDPNNPNNGYNAAFDFNDDGTITAGGDQTPFNARFGVTLQ